MNSNTISNATLASTVNANAITNLVRTDKANSYSSAGQNFTNSGSQVAAYFGRGLSAKAAITIGGASGDPTSVNNGDVWYDTTSNKIRARENGVSFDLNSGGQTPWTQDIDADGFDLTDLSNIEFRTTTGIPAGTVQYINAPDATRLLYNAKTGGSHDFNINGFNEYTFGATQADFNGNNLFGLGQIRWDGATHTFTASGSTLTLDAQGGGNFIISEGASNYMIFNNANSDTIDIFKQTDMNGNSLINVGYFESNATNPASTGAVRLGNNEELRWRNSANDNNLGIYVNGGDLLLFDFEGSAEYQFDALRFNVAGNDVINVKLLNQRFSNTTAIHEMEANHTTPAAAQVIGQIDFIDDDNLGARRTYGKITTEIIDPSSGSLDARMKISIAENNVLTDMFNMGSNAINVGSKFVMGGSNIENVGVLSFVNVNQSIQDSANNLQFDVASGQQFDFRVSNITEYSFTSTQADFNGNNIFDLGSVILVDSSDIGVGNSGFWQSSLGLSFNVGAAGDNYLYEIAGTLEYDFDATRADFNANNLINVGYIATDNAKLPTDGEVRLGNTDKITFRNFADNFSHEITTDSGQQLLIQTPLNGLIKLRYNATDRLEVGALNTTLNAPTGSDVDLNINGVPEYEFSATTADFNGNNMTGVGDITLNDTSNIIVNATTGTKIGTATTQKIGFWNATPVVQQAHIADPTGGATVDSEARTAINAINALLATLGLTAAA
jgi:hypothetical protein